jgi:hypothetical protein
MTIRSNKRVVKFKNPFLLEYICRTLPAGKYEVVTAEELLEGLSFYAYRQLQTYIYRQPAPDRKGFAQTYAVDPDELDDAIKRDEAAAIGDTGLYPGSAAKEQTSENGDEVSNQEAIGHASDNGALCHQPSLSSWQVLNIRLPMRSYPLKRP